MVNHPNRNRLSKAAMATLRYFARGYARDPEAFWVSDDTSHANRAPGLLRRGLLERADAPNADLFRITDAGRTVLEG